MIRVPDHLADRLDRLVDEYERSHVLGHLRLPNAYCERLPKHYIIERGLDVLEARRKRSHRSPRRRPGE